MSKSLCLAVLVFGSVLGAAELSEKFAKKINSAEETYKAAVQKADNTRFYAVQKANQDLTKVLKAALMDATKAGDFDAATEIKSRLTATPLREDMLAKTWQGPPGWGRFTFDSDGAVTQDSKKHTNGKWFVVDDDSALMTIYHEGQFQVLRFVFNKDRTKVTVYFIGVQREAAWEGKNIP